MKDLLNKEIKLSAHPLSWLFILFGFMAMIPGYPIAIGAFFVCLGLYQSFQSMRENNDILYTALLPVRKSDVVVAKYSFICLVELLAFGLMFILTVVRMTVFKDTPLYEHNAMMNANQAFLGYELLIFAVFNLVFVRGFFRTAYKFGKQFILFMIYGFILIGIFEILHHIPGLTFLNDIDTLGNGIHWVILIVCVCIYAAVTAVSVKSSQRLFEQVDL